MATTTPTTFTGTLRVTPEIIQYLTDAYLSNLGDSDKGTDPEDVCWYDGHVDAYEHALRLLHGMPVHTCRNCNAGVFPVAGSIPVEFTDEQGSATCPAGGTHIPF